MAPAALARVSDLERQKLLIDWNDTANYPEETLHSLFESQVAQHPAAIAIRSGGEQISYAELNQRSNRIAHALLQLDVAPKQVVAILMRDGPKQIEAMLGVLKAGGVFVCLDINYPTSRLNDIVQEARPSVVIAEATCLQLHSTLLAELEAISPRLFLLDGEKISSNGKSVKIEQFGPALLEQAPIANPAKPVDPGDPAYIVYTSGSTGKPKGIMQSHRSFSQFISWQHREFEISAPQRWAQWASIAYDASYCEIFGTLCFGATLCMAEKSVRHNPVELLAWVHAEKITILQVVPSFCRQLLDVLRETSQENGFHALASVRYLLLAGEVLHADLARALLAELPGPPKLYNLYGPSETVLATYHPVTSVDPEQQSISIGRAIDGRQILILDDNQQLCPIGEKGEIYIRSNYLTMGYVGRPEENAKKFIQNPLHHDYDDPVYRTGDLARWLPDGTLEFFGRMDNLVKLHGIRVELGDIEAALRQHSSIKNCAVIVREAQGKRKKLVAKERKAWEDAGARGRQMLLAYFTSTQPVASAELRRFLEDRLPSHMIPQQFIRLETLPLNANLKLDINALPEPDSLRPELAEAFVAPRTDLEQRMAAAWQEIIAIDRVGVNDSFFELGGDSLLAMQILNRIRQIAQYNFTFRDLFEQQTVAKLAALAEANRDAGYGEIEVHDWRSRKTFPVALSQQGLWFLWKLNPGNPFYTAQENIHLSGELDLQALRQAWQAMHARHDVLRVRFGMENGQPVQIFEERDDVDLPLIDLSHLPAAERRPAMIKELRKMAQQAFDLEKDVLMQARIYKLSETEHELSLTYHEIVIDLWGIAVLIRDLGEMYKRLLRQDATPLTPLKMAYREYVAWESENIRRERLEAQEAYWREQLAGELPVLNLPTDRPYPPVLNYSGGFRSVLLDAGLSARLQRLSAEEDATLFMTLTAALKVLLQRYSGQDDIIIGAPIANRHHEALEEMVGWFLNMLPLRTQLQDDPSFRDVLQRVKRTVSDGISNAAYQFNWMLESIKAVRDSSVSPVFQVMINWQNMPQLSLEYEGLQIATSETPTGYNKYELALYADIQGDQIYLQFAYLSDLFDPETVDRMLQNFVVLLNHIVEAPETPISRLRVLTEAERATLLHEFNRTEIDFGSAQNIHQLFEKQVARTPEATAFLFAGERMSYRELNDRANQLAHYLRRTGVSCESMVGLCVERSFDMIVAMLGVMKAGGCYVALDPDYPLRRLQDILDDTRPTILLIHKALDRFEQFKGRKVFIDTEWPEIAKESTENLPAVTAPHHLLNVVYTSSTTGKPKGALIPIRAVLNRLFWMWREYPFQENDVAVWHKSYSLVAATWECFGALLQGYPTLIVSHDDVLDPARFWQQVTNANVTMLLATPPLISGVLDQAEQHPGDWPGLRLATTSAEPIPPAMVRRWQQAFPGVPLLNLYGSTECASNASCYDTWLLPDYASRVPIGKPLANTRAYVLDQRHNPVPIGAVGELCIAGACVARGYLNLPEQTAAHFRQNPFAGDDYATLYRTGDLARIAAGGTLELVGRADDQVKLRGFRIELADIENALAQHRNVAKCSTALFEIAPGVKKLVGYVVPRREPAPAVSALQRFLRERLPEYMIPSAFVILDRLPMTPNGKVNRKALPIPDQVRPELETAYMAPRSETEKQLAGIWQAVLGLDRVGIHDNFFELGGHSLIATQVVAQIRSELHLELPLRLLFQAPTIAGLAQELQNLDASQAAVHDLPVIRPDAAHRFDEFPLTDIQQAYWIGRSGAFELGNVATHFYGEIDSRDLDLERLAAALNKLIARHDMLRCIVLPDGQQQILAQVPTYEIKVHDAHDLPADQAEAEVERVRRRMSHQVLPSDKWPLFEVCATRLGERHYRIHLSFDALIADAWSKFILFKEWQEFYANLQLTRPAFELTFRDYVLAEHELKKSSLYAQALDYWLARLADLPPAPDLPLAKNPAEVQQAYFAGRRSELPRQVWDKLKSRAARAGLTPSGVSMAAFAEVLRQWSRSPRFTVNLTLFNRLPMHPQVNEIVGDFTSLTMLAVDNANLTSFEARARQVQEQLWSDLDHRYVSGVRVLRELAKSSAGPPKAMMPVVFTSVLSHELEAPEADPVSWMGEVLRRDHQTPQVWLDHVVVEEGGRLVLLWNAVDELFPAGMLDDMFAAYQRLLRHLAERDEAWQASPAELAVLLLPERQRHLAEDANATDAPLPAGLLHDGFFAQAAKRPQHPAIISGIQRLSYGEVAALANRCGHRLRACKVEPNTLVAIVMEKGWEQVVAALGILQAGAAYLPIDAGVPKERLHYLLKHGEVRVVLTQARLREKIKWPDGVEVIAVASETLADADETPLPPVQRQQDLAYVIFTSGSTGKPKGVMIDHRGALNTIVDLNQRFSLTPEDRVLALSSLSFDLSVYDILGTLHAGATIVMPDATGLRDPQHWATLVEQEGVTIWNSVPALMELCVEFVLSHPQHSLQSLRLVMMSGDWIPVTLPDQIRTLSKNVELISMGGATEASIWSIIYPIGEVKPEWPSIPYGKAMVNQKFYVLNQAMELCPTWVPGQLYIGGIGLALGYWRDEEKTDASFIRHPKTGERLYRTGDLGRYLPDGNIEFLGREDFQIKIQGFRVELGEIETALLQHEQVRSAVVSAVGSKMGEKRLVAYVVAEPNTSLTAGELRDYLQGKLPPYLVPPAYLLLDRLPLTSNGKVDRKALPDPGKAEPADETTPARQVADSPSARRIRRIVCDVLKVSDVEPHANFMSLGATSIDMIRIVNRLDSELKFRPKMADFYLKPTVADLAQMYEAWQQENRSAIEGAELVYETTPKAILESLELELDPQKRAIFKASEPGLRRDLRPEEGVVLAPAPADEARMREHISRRSYRQFTATPISLASFSEFLSCLSPVQINGKAKYLYASAGGLYPVQTYLYVKPGRIQGVAPGTYYYHPVQHRLISLDPDGVVDRKLYDPFVNAPILDKCAFGIFLVAQMKAMVPMYYERSLHFCTLEGGLMSQLLETKAPASGIGLVQIGSMDFGKIRHLFKLDEHHVLVHSLLGGPIDPDDESKWSPYLEGHVNMPEDDAASDEGEI